MFNLDVRQLVFEAVLFREYPSGWCLQSWKAYVAYVPRFTREIKVLSCSYTRHYINSRIAVFLWQFLTVPRYAETAMGSQCVQCKDGTISCV